MKLSMKGQENGDDCLTGVIALGKFDCILINVIFLLNV
jgi:hypothetical protein